MPTDPHHVVTKGTYYTVFAWLAVLMVVTIAASRVDLGPWNVPIALAIAGIKATLIVLIFMHVWFGSALVKLFAASGFLWLGILFAFVAADLLTRN
jgi:cytochrome c oxidase subunit 4